MTKLPDDEWRTLLALLPEGWREAARETGAFRRARYITDPSELLRVLLFHAVHGGSLRETAAICRAGGIAQLSQVALLKRLRSSGDWLAWIARQLCLEQRLTSQLPGSARIRAVDSSSISGPASKGTDWRLHYSIDLATLDCDWHEVTDVHGAEALARTPMKKGDLMVADRNYLSSNGLQAAIDAGADVLIRLRWQHLALRTVQGRPFKALTRVKRLKTGQVGEWLVEATDLNGRAVPGRVIALRLPRPVVEMAQKRIERTARRKGKVTDDRTREAAKYIMLFTTTLGDELSAMDALEIYRSRWQVELAFKRLKQLLALGKLPHQDKRAARTWILSKLVVALLVEKLLRNAESFSPWGYRLDAA